MTSYLEALDVASSRDWKRKKAARWYLERAEVSDSNAIYRQFGMMAARIALGDADDRLDDILAEQADYDAG